VTWIKWRIFCFCDQALKLLKKKCDLDLSANISVISFQM